jgi:hypothetical protein
MIFWQGHQWTGSRTAHEPGVLPTNGMAPQAQNDSGLLC